MHEFLLKILAIILKYVYYLIMNTSNYEKLASHIQTGHVYRRESLLAFSKAIDRDLATLLNRGVLEKLSPGVYYKPAHSRYGLLPSKDEELVRCFLRDDLFLLYSWNQYNSLGLGLTQLYNRLVVYNRKRHGLFTLGGKDFDFRRPARGFPKKLCKEFLLIDLVNNLPELAEDITSIKQNIKKNLSYFNQKKISRYAKTYGKIATLKFFQELYY